MRVVIVCLLVTYLGVEAGCHKRLNCSENIYSFQAFCKAYPDNDSIKVNDTIWVELTTSTQLKDLVSNSTVDYSGAANFGTVIGYVEILAGDALHPGGIAVANSFENILTKGSMGQSLNPERLREFLFKEENGQYLLRVGIVPKKKGLFMIGVENAANVYRKNDKCIKASFRLSFQNTSQHLYLYEQKRPGYVLTDSDKEHLYAFKVY